MTTWDEISNDIHKRTPDVVRREKLKNLSGLTGRPAILYAVEMYNQAKINAAGGAQSISIVPNDITGFNEALRGIEGDNLDVVLHSPGGSPEATESIVRMLRTRFKSVRFIVPIVAKSAATMMTMAGDEIILGANAELGPTDPQLVINGKASPAHAILAQFAVAKKELSSDTSKLPAWLPILEQFGPALIAQCDDAISLSKILVKDWLKTYMLKGSKTAGTKAAVISKFLAANHLSHGRAISAEALKAKGVKIVRATEISPNLEAALDELNLALQQTFMMTGVIKVYENSNEKGFYHNVQPVMMQMPMAPLPKPR